jgi:hypothetical protein
MTMICLIIFHQPTSIIPIQATQSQQQNKPIFLTPIGAKSPPKVEKYSITKIHSTIF